MAVPDLFALDYVKPGHFGYTYSFVLGIVVLGIIVAAAIAALLVHAAQLMAAQRRLNEIFCAGAERKLSAGPNRVIKGVVEPTEGSPKVAIAVEIVQHVVNKTAKNSTWHEWKEDSRSEPNEDALVIDGLETVLPKHMRMKRLRTADVKEGETFYVSGDLHRSAHPRARSAYRDANLGWVMRPPRRDRMLLAPNVLAERYTTRALLLRNASVMFVACFLLMHSIFTVPFFLATAFGERTEAAAVNFRTFETRSKSTTIIHYVIALQTDDGTTFDAEVPGNTWRAVGSESSPRIPVLKMPRFERASFAGDHPSMNAVALILFCFGWTAAFLVLRVKSLQKVPWYDTNKFNERGESGHWNELR